MTWLLHWGKKSLTAKPKDRSGGSRFNSRSALQNGRAFWGIKIRGAVGLSPEPLRETYTLFSNKEIGKAGKGEKLTTPLPS